MREGITVVLLVLSVAMVAGGGSGPFASASTRTVGSGGTQLWASLYDSPGHSLDEAKAVDVSPDGTRVFVTGSSYREHLPQDFVTVAYSAETGGTLWGRRFGQPDRIEEGLALAVSPDGVVVYVTGYAQGLNSNDYMTIAYRASTGAQRWKVRFDGSEHGPDRPSEIAVSPDGSRVYVTGEMNTTGPGGYATVAYDSLTGTALWTREIDISGSAENLAVSPDGSQVFLIGEAHNNYGTVALDADTGDVQWIRGYNGPGNSTEDDGHDVAVSPDGSTVFVTGTSGRVVDVDYATVAYDAGTGAQLWVSRFDGPSQVDQAVAIDVTPDGSAIYVTGESFVDSVTIAYDSANGSQTLEARYAAEPGGELIPVALSLNGDGSQFFVLAHDLSATTNAYLTIAFDSATGDPVWSASYEGAAGSGIPASMAIDPIGLRLFVTGQATSAPENADYATVAYQI